MATHTRATATHHTTTHHATGVHHPKTVKAPKAVHHRVARSTGGHSSRLKKSAGMPDFLAIQITVTGIDEAEGKLAAFDAAASDLTEPLDLIREDFVAGIGRRFADEGPGWAPLTEKYATWKAAHGYAGGILVRTGDMLRDLTDPEGEIGPQGMTLRPSSDTPFIFHQDGTRRMPARPPVVVTEEDAARWGGIVSGFLATRLETA